MRLLGTEFLKPLAPAAIWYSEDVPQEPTKKGFFKSLPILGNYFSSQDELKTSQQALRNIQKKFQNYKTTAFGKVFAPSLDIPEVEDFLGDADTYDGSFIKNAILFAALVCLVFAGFAWAKNTKKEQRLEKEQPQHRETLTELENAKQMKLSLNEELKEEKQRIEVLSGQLAGKMHDETMLKENLNILKEEVRMAKEHEADLVATNKMLMIENEE
ncbi:hypothetical protein SK128_022182, partial [Halocaridina rubra]